MPSTYPEQLELPPPSNKPVRATVRIPGSKSLTNRALLIAALAQGDSCLWGALKSDDSTYMAGGLRILGVPIIAGDGDTVRVRGCSGRLVPPTTPVFVGNSGTTVRFLTAAAALLPEGECAILDGVARMRQRPIQDLLEGLSQWGVDASSMDATGCPPVQVTGGGLKGGSCTVSGSLSSQFLSALLMVAPFCRTDAHIHVVGELVSKPYASMTVQIMREFGVEVEQRPDASFFVPCGQKYSARTFAIEPDASNASYFYAAAALTGSTIEVEGLGTSSTQGDVRFVDVLEQMGCRVERSPRSISVTGPTQLSPVNVNMEDIPDTAQTAAVCAAFAAGTSRISGLSSLPHKETDRLAAMATELAKIGVRIGVGEDEWIIAGGDGEYRPALVDTYDDHRMAMALAVAGLKVPGLRVDDPGCVAKTFPTFWSLWQETFLSNDG